MRHVVLLLLAAAIVVGAALWIVSLPGHVSLAFGTTTVDAPVSWAVIALLALVVLVYALFRFGGVLFGIAPALRRGGTARARRRGEDAATAALVAIAAREPDTARRESALARRLLGDTPQTLLASAYAAQLAGKKDEAEAAFQKLAEHKAGAFLGYRGLLRQATDAEDWERAAELARQAERAHPGTEFLATERTHLAVRTGNWREALALSRGRDSHAALAAAAAEAETDAATARRLAKDAYRRDPLLAPAAIAYARRLREAGRDKAAFDVLRRAYGAAPHPDLAHAALESIADREARLKQAQTLTAGAADHPETHLLLGRLLLDTGHAQEAQRHAEAALKLGATQRRAYLLLADAEEALDSRAAHLDALRLAAGADPDPTWICEVCATPQREWRAACPVCHTAGRIRWQVPGRAPPLALADRRPLLPLDPTP